MPSSARPSLAPLVIPTQGRRRGWSTSCSSTTSQSSMASIYPGINHGSVLAEPEEGHTNVYGAFTTTIPAALWLRNHLSLCIPVSGKRRAKQRLVDCGYDTPPDSPLSFLPSSRRSPSITRTMSTDSDSDAPISPFPSPPSLDSDDSSSLHPILKAVEKRSKLSCKTVCSTCRKAGTNFPRCPRCDEMWCSRSCRLRGGQKHVCAVRKA